MVALAGVILGVSTGLPWTTRNFISFSAADFGVVETRRDRRLERGPRALECARRPSSAGLGEFGRRGQQRSAQLCAASGPLIDDGRVMAGGSGSGVDPSPVIARTERVFAVGISDTPAALSPIPSANAQGAGDALPTSVHAAFQAFAVRYRVRACFARGLSRRGHDRRIHPSDQRSRATKHRRRPRGQPVVLRGRGVQRRHEHAQRCHLRDARTLRRHVRDRRRPGRRRVDDRARRGQGRASHAGRHAHRVSPRRWSGGGHHPRPRRQPVVHRVGQPWPDRQDHPGGTITEYTTG